MTASDGEGGVSVYKYVQYCDCDECCKTVQLSKFT